MINVRGNLPLYVWPISNPPLGGYEAREIDARDLIHNADPHSNYYMAENERFDHNFSAYDKRQREKQREQFENNLESRRITNLEREQNKWQMMQQ